MYNQSMLQKALSILLLVVLVAAAQWQPTLAQAQALVRLENEAFEVGLGQVESLNILVENASDVYGLDIRGKFDPAVVEVVDMDPERDGVNLVPGKLVQPDFMVRNIADNVAGTFQYVITQVNPTEPANGSGVLFTLQLRGKAEGKQSPLTFSAITFANRRGITLDVTFRNGQINVVAPRTPTATPAPTPTPGLPEVAPANAAGNPPARPPADAGSVGQPLPVDPPAQPSGIAGKGFIGEMRAALMKVLYSIFPANAEGGLSVSLSSVGLWGIGGALVLVVGALLLLLVPSKKRKKTSA